MLNMLYRTPKFDDILMFVSKQIPNDAVMPQSLIVLIVLVGGEAVDQNNEYNRALQLHSIV